MNREIKFRAWDKHINKMYPVNVLGIYDNCSWQHGFGYFHNTQDWYGEEGFVIDPILMQFTGLTDKNGEEIYEGDILQWVSSNPFSKGEVRNVQVNYVQAQFWCQGTIGVYLAELLSNEKCKIIGNIYENPELIINL